MIPRYPWHDGQWERMAGLREAQRMPHALLLSGPEGVGKGEFARRLANSLVCATPDAAGDACGQCASCHLSKVGNHPDQLRIMPAETGKMIRIDAVRGLTAKSMLAAQQGGYRVFTIEPAEAMNRAAANALLKTLEEPGSRCILILVSSHAERLPATIRSRCHQLAFPIPMADMVREWLSTRAENAEVADLLAISGGAPLRALRALEDNWIDNDRRLLRELTALRLRKSNPMQIVEEWEKRPLTMVLDGLQRCLSDLVRLASGAAGVTVYHPALRDDLQSVGSGIDLKRLYGFSDELLAVVRNLSHNLNTQMILEHLANHWLQITRPGGERK